MLKGWLIISLFAAGCIGSTGRISAAVDVNFDRDAIYAMYIVEQRISSTKINSMELVLPPESGIIVQESDGPVIRVKASDNTATVLDSETEVLNFMAKNGWMLEHVFSYQANSTNIIKYIFIKQNG